ncbi:DUF2326 domain-containing protein [Vibrio europaeus]|uniref:DUF2326 domain-containing protein n=1 Tax=Vibrio europaeus TaxID=300876 RepID=UPI00233F70C7|nr:DUF2326 domain-containing protein [Vibrio europaeus]MDC5806383.1 DUF2326 domain-containing protein [Vibrio europaeus]MDC5807792.1 DUF2326 domain-containing protein [Vibrio europaeus]MDC5807992.1 DUF2326 domain-containing protein [Vibrio europaeus]MDC5830818.1 DUF2326 domain-containing protein [Vibrio europaeus]MDC5830908.1 DUF2326 domain-containing protein [Vibrio europaeus]
MKISKIYSNKPSTFEPIEFSEGFNVIIGEIRLPENKDRDSHNLGKSKLTELIDFGFLKKRHKETFLFKHFDRFSEFVFYFEFKLNDGSYLTVRRSVEKNTQIYLKRHTQGLQDFSSLADSDWDYEKLTFDKARLLMDSFFNLTSIIPWDYRMTVNYALRNQDDFNDIFQLKKFGPRHIAWKPYVGHTLGFDSNSLTENYELKASIDKLTIQITELQKEIGDYQGDEEEMLQDALATKLQYAETLQIQLDQFNFDEADAKAVVELSEDLDDKIEELNRVRYYLTANIKKLRRAQQKKPTSFDISKTEKLFEEAGILLGDQIKKSYDELLEFSRKITIERAGFVKQQMRDLEKQLLDVSSQLTELNAKKSQKVSFLTSTDTFEKYKEASNHMLLINTEINAIKRKLEISEQMKNKQEEFRQLGKKKDDVIEKIRVNRDLVMKSQDSVYKIIKDNFSHFVKQVLDKDGRISTEQNKEGNLVYRAGFIDDTFSYTSESDGHSYKKILCMGYDLAVNLAYQGKNFARFIYHDGGLETLDSRKKIAFLKYARSVPELHGSQYILTVIDSDLPEEIEFTEDEIALRLHDDGDEGLLFKMPSW